MEKQNKVHFVTIRMICSLFTYKQLPVTFPANNYLLQIQRYNRYLMILSVPTFIGHCHF